MDCSTDTFVAHRDRLFGIAYRMLGTVSDAEDVVQECWLRWQAQNPAAIDNPAGYLTRIATSISIDALRRERRRRELYAGPWLPEPLPENFRPGSATSAATGASAEDTVELAQTLSLALLALLETLRPNERATFVLRSAFQMSFDEIGACLDAAPATCRQWFHRARGRLGTIDWAEREPDRERERLERFLSAIAAGDAAGVVGLLSDDVCLLSDGGGKVIAATRPLNGARAVSRFLLGVAARGSGRTEISFTRVNGGWGALIRLDGRIDTVLTVSGAGERIGTICLVRNPDKLRAVGAAL